MSTIRADKYLATCLNKTRSEVKKLIRQGKFSDSNGPIKNSDAKISLDKNYYFEQKQLQYEEFEYYLFHKPAGCVSATKDNLHKTVLDFFPPKPDLFPVGRLDIDTTGLLLITNDGQLAHDLLSPVKHVQKTYEAVIDGIVLEEDVRLFQNGFDYGEKKISKPAFLQIVSIDPLNQKSLIHLFIVEGKFHQVKRMFEYIDKPVLSLKRIGFGPFQLEDTLTEGSYRKLSDTEIKMLKEN